MIENKKTLIAFAVISFSAFNAQAQWSVNVGPITVAPDASSSNLNVVEQVAALPSGSTSVTVNDNTQLGITVDYSFNRYWSASVVAATPFSHNIRVAGSAIDGLAIGDTKHLPPTIFARFYPLTSTTDFMPFIGVGINYTHFFQESVSDELRQALTDLGVANTQDTLSLNLDASFGLAYQAGFDWRINQQWGVHLMFSMIDIETDAEVRLNNTAIQKVNVQIDPLVSMLGVKYYF
ncbi:outer membrane beta-barrel protein [Rheinheimera sp. SM2107]|uniref:Outer membrane beta-barrel protein n=2 Tax=Arsukibacterium indicum TaxID=2848612 RepID=A0ABS6MPN9_9GAMM|nr:outer membrane beta-barrel protein [Arsukibacterium indicum]